MILHTINKSPSDNSSLQTCLKLVGTADIVLLIEDGVFGALRLSDENLNTFSFYALQEDLQARGLTSTISPKVKQISYAGFVALTLQCSKVHAWS